MPTAAVDDAEGEAGHARYTFRLRVSSNALTRLEVEWARCRWVWNECVAMSRKVHARNKRAGEKATCGPSQLDKLLTGARQSMVWLREGSSVPQQQIIRDFDYTQRGFRLTDGRLHLAGGVAVTVVWSRDLPGPPSSVRVYRDSAGHWYASFVVSTTAETLPATGAVIGIDWGVREIATTTSDDHDLPHAEHGRKVAGRRVPKSKAQSKGYRQARRQAAKVQKKIARQRQDTARKWAKKVVRDHDALAVEDFKAKFLAKSTMARKAADAAIGATKTALIQMGRKHGRAVHLVHPAHTTMDCAQCGARTKHALPLSERTYACTACGVVSPRDKNSARVMLARAGLNPAGADRVRACGPLVRSQREPGIPSL
ncbi:transposase [Streptomyces sp. ZAF1911]|uniref:RNA-guided endonuclease InsQ/TnpB family protein n=1 Tax=Streptomyces sp. ZAF1911 TaxID=2944129 RepID=UPI00237B1EE3|nr:transposase [Streptomyces sp. ZAF1911]MDD9376369.1 transposase [Streptomyces sp. ZAF1911]